eukprot:gene22728-28884_t
MLQSSSSSNNQSSNRQSSNDLANGDETSLEGDEQWYPSIELRDTFRDIAAASGDLNNAVSAAYFSAHPGAQKAVRDYFETVRPSSNVPIPTGRGRKTAPTPPRTKYTTQEVILGAPSRDIIRIDFDGWPDDLVLDIANFICPLIKNYGQKQLVRARTYLNKRFNCESATANWDTIFPPQSNLDTLILSDIQNQQLGRLRDWALTVGMFTPGAPNQENHFMHHVQHIASFVAGPLTPDGMREKRRVCEEFYRQLKRFCSTRHPHPSMFITLTLTPNVLSDQDLKRFAVVFKIPEITIDSLVDDIKVSCLSVGRLVLTEPYRLHDDAFATEGLPEEWLPGICLYLLHYLLRDLSSPILTDFMQMEYENRTQVICDLVMRYVRSSAFDHQSIPWATVGTDVYNDILAAMRTFNAFDTNSTSNPALQDHGKRVRAMVLSLKHHLTEEGSGDEFAAILTHLKLPLLRLRRDFTTYGPFNGRPRDQFFSPLGEASESTPRHFMTETQGAAHVETHNFIEAPASPTHSICSSVFSLDITNTQNSQPPNPCVTPSSNHFRDLMDARRVGSTAGSIRSGSVSNFMPVHSPATFRTSSLENLRTNNHKRHHSDITATPSSTQEVSIDDDDWLSPVSDTNTTVTPSLWGTEEEKTVKSGAQWVDTFDDNVALTNSASKFATRFPITEGSSLRQADVILIPDPCRRKDIATLNYNTAFSIPLTALFVMEATTDQSGSPAFTTRVLATNVNLATGTQSSWTTHDHVVTVTRPLKVLKANPDMQKRYTLAGAVTMLTQPPSKRPTPNKRGESDTITTSSESTSSFGVSLGNGITFSKTSLTNTDKSKFIPFLVASVDSALLDTGTGGQKTLVNAYNMERVFNHIFPHWLQEIALGNKSQYFIHTINTVKKSALAVHLASGHPDIAICVYLFDWKTTNCLNPKTSMYLEYFLPADQCQPITTYEALYTALFCLNIVIYLLHGWQDLLTPILTKLRPMEGYYHKLVSVQYWITAVYNMLAQCTQLTLNNAYHGPSILPGDNLTRLRKIIQTTADLPFTYNENQRFLSEAVDTIPYPDALTFGTKSKAPPTTPQTGGATQTSAKTPKETTGGTLKQKPGKPPAVVPTTTGKPAPRDLSAYAAAGITIPPNPPNPPDTLLCIMDFMAALKVPFEDGTMPRKCTSQHSAKTGKRVTTRLHVDEVATYYPDKYSKQAALHQCCYYLNDKPNGDGPPTFGSVVDPSTTPGRVREQRGYFAPRAQQHNTLRIYNSLQPASQKHAHQHNTTNYRFRNSKGIKSRVLYTHTSPTKRQSTQSHDLIYKTFTTHDGHQRDASMSTRNHDTTTTPPDNRLGFPPNSSLSTNMDSARGIGVSPKSSNHPGNQRPKGTLPNNTKPNQCAHDNSRRHTSPHIHTRRTRATKPLTIPVSTGNNRVSTPTPPAPTGHIN